MDNLRNQAVVEVYIFRNFSQYVFTELNKNDNEEERRSGTIQTGGR